MLEDNHFVCDCCGDQFPFSEAVGWDGIVACSDCFFEMQYENGIEQEENNVD
ncbi:DNA-directed RNA polymerase [Pseudomonas phage EM]|uniref:DNA-directed RNA polymerase n=1 Tax=Pseudomonas phage EM TaxID=2936914 RepID=A0AAE9HHH7_9CAUD|nr:DNA-directed RNA polymerase [Pseudomonas phage EM]UPW35902.1 DNA-directed RNA polymerase [Pseudomonas phage EM]